MCIRLFALREHYTRIYNYLVIKDYWPSYI